MKPIELYGIFVYTIIIGLLGYTNDTFSAVIAVGGLVMLALITPFINSEVTP